MPEDNKYYLFHTGYGGKPKPPSFSIKNKVSNHEIPTWSFQ